MLKTKGIALAFLALGAGGRAFQIASHRTAAGQMWRRRKFLVQRESSNKARKLAIGEALRFAVAVW
jgi:hypothetical protein